MEAVMAAEPKPEVVAAPAVEAPRAEYVAPEPAKASEPAPVVVQPAPVVVQEPPRAPEPPPAYVAPLPEAPPPEQKKGGWWQRAKSQITGG